MTLSSGIGPLGLTGKLCVDDDALRIVEHGVPLEIPYADIVEVKHGAFMTWISLTTSEGRQHKLTLSSNFKKVAKEIQRKAGLEKGSR